MTGSTRRIQSCTFAGFQKGAFPEQPPVRAEPNDPHKVLAEGTEPLHSPAPSLQEGKPSVLQAGCKTARNIQQKCTLNMTKITSSYCTHETLFYQSFFLFYQSFFLSCRYHTGHLVLFQSTGASLLAGGCTRLGFGFFCWSLEFPQPPAERARPAHSGVGSPV